MSNLISLRDAP